MKNLIRHMLVSLIATAFIITGATAAHATSLADGKALYNANCAGCHGELASSKWLGATQLMILTGISSVPEMSGLGALTADQILSISQALDSSPPQTPSPRQPPKPEDGATLYSANCAGCHGALSSSSVARVSSRSIEKAINTNKGGMRSVKLNKAQLAYIAVALSGRYSESPSGGKADETVLGDTYTSRQCAECHYPDGKVKHGAAAMTVNSASSGGTRDGSGNLITK